MEIVVLARINWFELDSFEPHTGPTPDCTFENTLFGIIQALSLQISQNSIAQLPSLFSFIFSICRLRPFLLRGLSLSDGDLVL